MWVTNDSHIVEFNVFNVFLASVSYLCGNQWHINSQYANIHERVERTPVHSQQDPMVSNSRLGQVQSGGKEPYLGVPCSIRGPIPGIIHCHFPHIIEKLIRKRMARTETGALITGCEHYNQGVSTCCVSETTLI